MSTRYVGFLVIGFLFLITSWLYLWAREPYRGLGFLVIAGVCFVLAAIFDPNQPKGGSVKWTEG